MARVHVLNGVNLGSLGSRRPEVYGTLTLADIENVLREAAGSDGLVINPGAWTHYSYALHDALEALDVPKVEVHLSNVHGREEWRRRSVISPAVDAVVAGMGVYGYRAAVGYVLGGRGGPE